MASFFYNLGKLAGPKIRKAQWAWAAATAPQDEVIEAEYRVGAEMAQQVRTMSRLCPEGEYTELLRTVGERLGPFVNSPLRKFTYTCLDSETPQAFCLPGGFIFVSDSIIELCDGDKNMVAFVCAHEMAHVIEGHAMERMVTHSIITAAARPGVVGHVAGGMLQKMGISFLQNAYSQDNEYHADALALRLTAAAGFDPKVALKLFDKLMEFEHKPLWGSYFSTHPPCRSRIERLQNNLDSL